VRYYDLLSNGALGLSCELGFVSTGSGSDQVIRATLKVLFATLDMSKKKKPRTIVHDKSKVRPFPARETPGYRERVYDIVRRIPAGRVMTYGQIANMLGEGYTPRTVGYVMHASGEKNVPWQRVINSQGACSTGRIVLPTDMQQRMLEAEGVKFDASGRCDLNEYRCLIDIVDDRHPDDDKQRTRLFRGAAK
jgi:methylated-DNA-protein-cysteine methyltransferase-like protein